MANTKISALTVATTPLAGTEVLPIVQSGVTKQVSVANLTAGRAVSADSLTLTGSPLPATSGGTGQSSYAVGDLLYASTTTALSKLADVATGNALISGGVGVAPSWGKVGLTTHVSGTLPVANGGTGITSLTAGYIPYGNGTSAFSSGTGLTYSSATLTVQSTANIGGGGTDGVIGLVRAAGQQVGTITWVTATDEFQFNNNNGGIYNWRNNGANQMRLFASGGLSLGNTTDPGATNLSVNGGIFIGTTAASVSEILRVNQTANAAAIYVTPTNASYSGTAIYTNTTRAANSAFDLIGSYANSVGQFRVTGAGVIYAQNTTVQSISDQRLKENIKDSLDGLDVINALRPVRFDWKPGFGNDQKNQLGFIAQEIEVVFPDAVSEWQVNKDDETIYKTVGPAALIPVLVKAIQELTQKLKAANVAGF